MFKIGTFRYLGQKLECFCCPSTWHLPLFYRWHLSGPKSSTTISIPPTGSKWIAIDDKVSTLSLLLGLAGSQLDVDLIAFNRVGGIDLFQCWICCCWYFFVFESRKSQRAIPWFYPSEVLDEEIFLRCCSGIKDHVGSTLVRAERYSDDSRMWRRNEKG